MREEISIAHRILPSRLASRDARREGKTSRFASRDAIFSDFHRASHRAMRFSAIFIAHCIARCAARGKNIAPRIARCEARGKKHRASHCAMRGAREKNIAPRIARCEARCFFIVKRVRIFIAGVILLTNPLRANDHMAKISHFRLRQLHPRFYQELTAIFSLKSCVAVSFGFVHN